VEALPRPNSLIRFGVFEADLRSGELRRDGRKVPLQERPFQVLTLLLERPGEVVTREDLRQSLWPADVFVDFDQGLNNAVKKLRLALDDSSDNPRFVETLARRGYRFIAPVEWGVRPTAPPESGRTPPRLAAAALAVAAVLFLVYAARDRWPGRPQPAGRIMMAVLPFDNLSGDVGQEYLSDGMTEEMIAQVGRVDPGRLGVIGRASALHFKGKVKSAEEVGRELGVDYILSGSVRRAGARIRVTAALVRVKDQVQLWSRSYDRELRDVIDLQSDVARAIAAEIPVSLTAGERARLANSRPVKPDAYESYLQGRYQWNRINLEGERKAIAYFEKALAEDPGHAPTWAWLASAVTMTAHMGGLPPKQAMSTARAAIGQALALDPGLAEAHVHDGFLKLTYEWQFGAAAEAFRRALALNPSLANAHQGYSLYLAAMGRVEESVTEMRRARDLDPLSVVVSADVCLALYYARRYDEAIALCRKTLEMDPGSLPAHLFLTQLYEVKGMHAQAIESRIATTSVNSAAEPWFPVWSERLRSAYRASGWRGSRKVQIESLVARQPTAPELAYAIAREYALLGDRVNALDWLEKAYDGRRYHLAFLKADPLFDLLRGEPRFEDLLRRIGLPR
jgi:TolB-like protein/DNA-binding winged helix-turn-helix (wHTH) protein/tetratricopeptide (TPR) repeat protein